MIDNDNQNISNILIKLENFENRIIILEKDNIILKKENEKLKEEIESLKKEINTINKNQINNSENSKIQNIKKEEKKETNSENIIEKKNEILESEKKEIKKNEISIIKKLKEINTIEAHDDAIFKVSVFPSGNFVSVSSDKSIKIWNKQNENIQIIKNAHNDTIYYISIKDENNFATCSFDNSIKIWIKKNKNNKFECIETINKTHNKTIFKVIYCLNNEIISCSYDKTVKIWSNENKKKIYECIKIFNHKVFVNTILLLQDKNILISAGWDGTYFWNYKTYENIIKINDAICLSCDALRKFNNNQIIVGGKGDCKIKIIDINNFKIINEVYNEFTCYGILVMEKIGVFLTGGKCKDIKVFSCSDLKCIQNIIGAHNNSIIGFTQLNEKSVISFSWDNTIKIWSF